MENLSWPPIIFGMTNVGVFAWFLVRIHFKSEQQQKQIESLLEENKELKENLRELSDMILVVKNNTDLLLLGRIKTNGK